MPSTMLSLTNPSSLLLTWLSSYVKGNNYRLVVQIDYRKGIVVAVFFGTHEEYDEFNAKEG